jgi:hypothetical protein
MQGSEDEEDSSLESPPLVELIKTHLRRLINFLEAAIPKEEITNSFDNTKMVPLGSIRLKIVEFIQLVFKLHKS